MVDRHEIYIWVKFLESCRGFLIPFIGQFDTIFGIDPEILYGSLLLQIKEWKFFLYMPRPSGGHKHYHHAGQLLISTPGSTSREENNVLLPSLLLRTAGTFFGWASHGDLCGPMRERLHLPSLTQKSRTCTNLIRPSGETTTTTVMPVGTSSISTVKP